MAILISYIAYQIGRKEATGENTFGYRRAEVMAALLNVIILAGACLFILYGAFQGFLAPEIAAGKIVIWAALVGTHREVFLSMPWESGFHKRISL